MHPIIEKPISTLPIAGERQPQKLAEKFCVPLEDATAALQISEQQKAMTLSLLSRKILRRF